MARPEDGAKRLADWPRRGVKFCFCSTTGWSFVRSGVEGAVCWRSATLVPVDFAGLVWGAALVATDAEAADEKRLRRTGLGWNAFCGTAGNMEFEGRARAGVGAALGGTFLLVRFPLGILGSTVGDEKNLERSSPGFAAELGWRMLVFFFCERREYSSS